MKPWQYRVTLLAIIGVFAYLMVQAPYQMMGYATLGAAGGYLSLVMYGRLTKASRGRTRTVSQHVLMMLLLGGACGMAVDFALALAAVPLNWSGYLQLTIFLPGAFVGGFVLPWVLLIIFAALIGLATRRGAVPQPPSPA